MKLLLPLKHYDDAGRVKPPLVIYFIALFLCRSLLVLIGAVSSKQYTNELLSLFYGDNRFFYLSLVIAMPTLVSLVIIGFREKLWCGNRHRVFFWIKPLMLFSCLADFIYHVYFANTQHWQFSWVIAITLLLDIFCLYYLSKDKHIAHMLLDWRNTTQDSPK